MYVFNNVLQCYSIILKVAVIKCNIAARISCIYLMSFHTHLVYLYNVI